MDLVVRTERGAVRGTAGGELCLFKGIPYAAPLDGPRRFQAPEAPERWEGERDASEFSASVPQPPILPGLPSSWNPGDSAESLTVNVWTPDLGGGLPVLVWIHGGAFLGGSSSEYDPARLAQAGVVVVTVNYRVGYEGFGWVADAPANRGILDQLAALRWVQDNIASFGGDPGNVTIFGESAGATSVATLVAGSADRGLFRRAIAQSLGSLFCAEDEFHKASELVLGRLGVSATAEELGAVAPEAIHGAQAAAMAEINQDRAAWTNSTPYAVVFDGAVLDDLPWAMLRRGSGRGVELICGYNTHEARMFTVDMPAAAKDPAQLARGLRLDPSVVEQYRAGYPGEPDAELYALMLSDQLFRMPGLWSAEAHAQAGGRSYLYEFAWPAPGRDGVFGACHGLDIPFTFGVSGDLLGTTLLGEEPPADFETLSAELRGSWISFATSGDPGWPEYTAQNRQTRIWHVPSRVVADPVKASREIWQHRFPA
ncbi:para-nitrobenzyl esterase [Saccharopolyspora antimicrobica]|uniref:Carboxylic ester hydrolase n=1 Tax=Saccharopolyspora antimicrobica TaxID=455193 RepID=A0A1I4SGL6_9PSEU|nr:carboxylesterase family protein [Saccharopolyspora antimicrobica]RKT87731.1 para-nitrobenzyl esterase [Saccharopolyspora antimicrobica]SFM63450.1 para-nitrobenzyl esterase [Saccharopolyspora antimicrobica]